MGPGEDEWHGYAAAFVCRMSELVRSILVLMEDGRTIDGGLLLRALYEHVVKFCWIAADAETRYPHTSNACANRATDRAHQMLRDTHKRPYCLSTAQSRRPAAPRWPDKKPRACGAFYRGAEIRTRDLTDPNRSFVHAIRHKNSC